MKKHRPCLRCDKLFPTVPEIRICNTCKKPTKHPIENSRLTGNYPGWSSAIQGMDYFINPKTNAPKNTRYNE